MLEYQSEQILRTLEWVGMLLMTSATLTGLVDLPSHLSGHQMKTQKEFAFVTQTANLSNPMLRERDEAGPHYITYAINRTVARSGKR